MKTSSPLRAAGRAPFVAGIEFASRPDNAFVPLPAGVFVVGSDPSSDVVLEGRGVLEHHATLVVGEDGNVRYRAEAGARATLHGRSIQRGILVPGDVLVVGAEVLVFHRVDPAERSFAPSVPGLRGHSAPMRTLARTVHRFRALDIPVLIHGPSGTGKDAIASAIHGDVRAGRPFVVANVAAFPRTLCESELFGHARGAFTGADRDHVGLLSQADGGTLFLDEIGELPLDVQPKLLRALDGYGFRAVGGRAQLRPRVRVVTASHVDLRRAVALGAFRNDLLHRLEVLVVETHALAHRRSDIAAIAHGIVAGEVSRVRPVTLSPAAVAALVQMDWPGNVRELRNVLLRAAALATGPLLDATDVRRAKGVLTMREAVQAALPALDALVAEAGGNVTRAARAANMPRTSFRRRLAEWQRLQTMPAPNTMGAESWPLEVPDDAERLLAAE